MSILACKEVYRPPGIEGNQQYLVVDGTIVSGDDSTMIKLSRTRNLADTATSSPETGARVMVVGEAAETFPLQEIANGKYVIDQLNLNNNEKYQLKIITSTGTEYLSDEIAVKQTPAIDSLSWFLDTGGVYVYLTTHDPQNSTWYYRWTYSETWKYHTAYETIFDVVNGEPDNRPSPYIYFCYQSDNSTSIQVGSSIKLSQDIIYKYPITYIVLGDEKISKKYSILVRQFAISPNTYNYWQNLKKNTEELGTLFDAQPSQLPGNVHCLSNPNESVLGYVDASTLQTKRLFIADETTVGRRYLPYFYDKGCVSLVAPIGNLAEFFPDSGTRKWVFIGTTSPPGGFIYTNTYCGDCRDHGGTNIKPSFWIGN